MPHKEEILKAATELVAAQKRSIDTGVILDTTLLTLDNQGEETEEDSLALIPQPSPLHTFAPNVLSPDG